MILKWINEKSQWVIKDGFDEIRHKTEENEKEKTITRTVCCYIDKDYENDPSLVLTDTIKMPKEDDKEHEDFSSMYILNDEGKTIERIN
jgi:hypothetical protein